MANELQKLPNPDNVPGAVTTGYQQQNINILSLQTGLDTTEPYDDGNGLITVPAGGIIEVNGNMFKIVSSVTLTKGNLNTAYWIEVIDNGGGKASLSLVTRPGVWDSAKQGCYNSNNRRTLKWVSLGNISLPPSSGAVFSKNVKGKWEINLKKGWYYIELESGKGGGDGENANGQIGGKGGVANKRVKKAFQYFSDGKNKNIIKIGGDAWDGGKGGVGQAGCGSGGGGASGSGEETIFDLITTGDQPGGDGGDGSDATAQGMKGGGGGGGDNGGKGGAGKANLSSVAQPTGGSGAGKNENGQDSIPSNTPINGGKKNGRGTGDGGIGNNNNGGGGGSSWIGGGKGNSGGGNAGSRSNGGDGSDATAPNYGGAGGGQGADGQWRQDGEPGGSCYIYELGN